ncbi:mechanosensitive ion channel family protein [Mobilitalea sibirica]|uniref:Mechanosensitive ion channel family protein n=1 Tax=Mobilitalea sibirica TaxID=1462919 RepID=A0A8J7KWT5_9FIRM|nr:mechanosensitive ion channel family protein [Mobilitalea sibirica]MBH1941740.1 mechanosensitive ion channel family protein [Mobilitalea sibirica]
MKEFLEQIYFNNSMRDYIWSLSIFIVSFIVITILRYFMIKRIKARAELEVKTSNDILIHSTKKYLIPLMYLSAFYFSVKLLTIQPMFGRVIDIVAIALISVLVAVLVSSLLEYSFQRYSEKTGLDENKQVVVGWFKRIIKVLIWVVAIILFVQNIGIDISAIVAGLGIGGIAIAFAAQAVLEDIFSYFTIYFDRPFEVGDFIISGEHMGTVEHIGIRTTRLRSIGGEQLILSNKDLTNSRVKNYKRMEQRRVLFTLGVTYDTTLDQLKKIPELVKDIIERQEDTRFDRAHFSTFANSSLNFEVVYYVLSSDYIKYMDIQQEINFTIKEQFDKLGIEFAFPTQTIHVQNANM